MLVARCFPMGDSFFLLLLLLALMAIFLRERLALTLLYFFVAAYAIGRGWSRRALNDVRFQRTYPHRAFLYDRIPVQLDLINTGWLPAVWVQLMDSLPVELAVPNSYRRVITLGPYGRERLTYTLRADKRGYYVIGPLYLRSGDLLGLADDTENAGRPDRLIVYPKIIPFTKVPLPSRSPLGTLRHTQPIFEDPTRVRGKRDYAAGDPYRRIDWKATAAAGRLQVKVFEPSIALETLIVLNLNSDEYDYRTRLDATELAVITAASLANWLAGQKQPIGLVVNGADPLNPDQSPALIAPHTGRPHLMRLLDVLARVRAAPTPPLIELLRRELPRLTWGTTLVLITGAADDAVFDEIFRARRAGLNVVLILMGMVMDAAVIRRRARQFSVPLFEFMREHDLDVWRK